MNAAPFNLLVVADDRSLLRYLSRFLDAFGYDMAQAAGTVQALSALEARRTDFILLDDQTQGKYELLDLVRNAERRTPFTILLAENPTPASLVDSLKRGVDDFLAKPVVHGEVLSRLRAGARVLEHDRRISQNWGLDHTTGIPNREAFLRTLSERMNRHQPNDGPLSCVVLTLDFLERVFHAHGPTEGDQILHTVTEVITEVLRDNQFLASLGGGRFGVLLPGTSAEEAVMWATRLQAIISESDIRLHDKPFPLVASLGVAESSGGDSLSDELLQQATEAAVQAKRSGGDLVVRFGQFDEEKAAWKELAAPGRLFEQTSARDIMIPCTVTLRESDSADLAKRLMQQTKWNVIPVVNAAGQLVGAVRREDSSVLDEAFTETVDVSPTIQKIMRSEVMHCDETTGFSEVLDYFSTAENDAIYVTHDNRPCGVIHRANLASLSQPLRSDTFVADVEAGGSGTEMLRVAD